MNWNGERCIPCTAGKVFIKETRSCECPPPLKWNGFACARLEDCQNGTEWNVYTYRCECPDHQYWHTARRLCLDIPICTGGQILDSTNRCVCPNNYYWNGQRCQFTLCTGGQRLIGDRCICPAGTHWNDTNCLECINGQEWNKDSK